MLKTRRASQFGLLQSFKQNHVAKDGTDDIRDIINEAPEEIRAEIERLEIKECLAALQEGTFIKKYTRNRWKDANDRFMWLDLDNLDVKWRSPSQAYNEEDEGRKLKGTDFIKIAEITRLSIGTESVYWKRRPAGRANGIEIATRKRYLRFETSSREDFLVWVLGILYAQNRSALKRTQLEMDKNDISTQFISSKNLKDLWNLCDDDDSGSISMFELVAMLKALSVPLDTSYVEFLFKFYDGHGSNVLSFPEFKSLMIHLFHIQAIVNIFNEISNPTTHCIDERSMVDFLKKHQKEEIVGIRPFKQRFLDLDAPFRTSDGITGWGLNMMLISPVNSIYNPSFLKQHHDMDAPLTDYLINTSHNTLLTGTRKTQCSADDKHEDPPPLDRFSKPVDPLDAVKTFIMAIERGSRCVEIDIWTGKEDPIVYYGQTIQTWIPLASILKSINDNAFEDNLFPLILALNVHTNAVQTVRIAELLRTIFGDKLMTPKKLKSEFPQKIPSPKDLINKVLVQARVIKENEAIKLESQRHNHEVILSEMTTFRKSKDVSFARRKKKINVMWEDTKTYVPPECHLTEFGGRGDIISPIATSPVRTRRGRGEDPYGGMYTTRGNRSEGAWTQRMRDNQSMKDLKSVKNAMADWEPDRVAMPEMSFNVLDITEFDYRSMREHSSIDGEEESISLLTPKSSRRESARRELRMTDLIDANLGLVPSTYREDELAEGESIKDFNQIISMNVNHHILWSEQPPNPDKAHLMTTQLEERKAIRCIEGYSIEECKFYTDQQLVTVRPQGSRSNSQNIDPFLFWEKGIQSCGINLLADGRAAKINDALFRMNGNTGFLRKSSLETEECMIPVTLKVKVLCARQLPRASNFVSLRDMFTHGNIAKKKLVDKCNPYVEVAVHGVEKDMKTFETHYVPENGMDPAWGVDFTFKVSKPHMAMLSFTVRHYDSIKTRSLGWCYVPICAVREGIRWCPLTVHGSYMNPVEVDSAGVLVQIAKIDGEFVSKSTSPLHTERPAVPISNRYGAAVQMFSDESFLSDSFLSDNTQHISFHDYDARKENKNAEHDHHHHVHTNKMFKRAKTLFHTT